MGYDDTRTDKQPNATMKPHANSEVYSQTQKTNASSAPSHQHGQHQSCMIHSVSRGVLPSFPPSKSHP
jgi:hypothetical protein